LLSRTPVRIGLAAGLAVGLTAGLVGLYRLLPQGPAHLSGAPPPAASTTNAAPGPAVTAPTPAPEEYRHVVVVVLENHSFDTVIGNPQAPYLNVLAQQWSLATGYSGVSHPSLPNYLALIGGGTFGVSSDCTACFVAAPSLPDRLEAAGKTWKAYMEGMPQPCYTGSSGLYAQKHDPFMYFDDIRTDPARCARIVPYSSLAADFSSPSTAPDFAFVTPNLCNDGHDCTLSTTDTWLSREVPALLASPAFSVSPSLLVVTYDEGEGGSNRVATVLIGNGVKHGYRSAAVYDHYSLLRTIEGLWRLQPLAAGDASASPMTEFLTPLAP
jgi:phosphatidylinositol-3-phosphatase